MTHEDLLRGKLSEKLPSATLKKVQSVYLEKPFFLEKDIDQFISSAKGLADASDDNVSSGNPISSTFNRWPKATSSSTR